MNGDVIYKSLQPAGSRERYSNIVYPLSDVSQRSKHLLVVLSGKPSQRNLGASGGCWPAISTPLTLFHPPSP